ncbi:hypothetical protein CTA1_6962 [Colletotrichum tanaceti]|uniref:Uncharacterized protein n=1 Tax=Colletotrichum tanaceti TaxID=1306861 RepID=A0A4U6XGD0_9PEZI|nr:hypothetical protein CTA1_6962 [Colletotrichum tanaceti]
MYYTTYSQAACGWSHDACQPQLPCLLSRCPGWLVRTQVAALWAWVAAEDWDRNLADSDKVSHFSPKSVG